MLLLLLASRPTAVEGFGAIPHGGFFGIRCYANDAAQGWGDSSSGSRCLTTQQRYSSGSSRETKDSCMLFMGASRDDHTDRKDQWEGWGMEDSGAGEDTVSMGCGVCARLPGGVNVLT